MIALLDTNVILDVLLARGPFVADSSAVMGAVEASRCRGLLCATTVTTIHYIARRKLGTGDSLRRISDLLAIFEDAPVNRVVLEAAMASEFEDFEDAVLHEAGVQSGVDCIVTRNAPDFSKAKLLVYSPAQFLKAIC